MSNPGNAAHPTHYRRETPVPAHTTGESVETVIVVKTGRQPHEVALLIGCLLFGLAGTIAFDAVAVTSLRALPEAFGQVFFVLLAVGAAVPLVGIFKPGLEGPLIERIGLWVLTIQNVFFAAAVAVTSWPRGFGFIVMMTMLAVANVVRALQIPRQLRRIAAAAAVSGSVDQLEGE